MTGDAARHPEIPAMSAAVGPALARTVLRLKAHDRDNALSFRDFQLASPVIVLWDDADVEIEVRQTRSRGWTFRPRPASIDLYAAGSYSYYGNTAGRRRELVAHLPIEWSLDAPRHGENPASLHVHTRMQFHDRSLERLLRRLRSHVEAGEPLGPMFSEMLSIAIVQLIAGHRPGPGSSDPGGVLLPAVQRRLGDFIEHQLDAPPAIDQLAALAGLGISSFLKAFRASFAMTPHQYVMHRRVERAKRFLLADAESLADLAARLGFASHAHFTTVFHAKTGLTPSEFRRRQMACVSLSAQAAPADEQPGPRTVPERRA